MAIIVVGFDATILNVALSTLSTQLDASNDQLQWIVDSYLLVFAAALLPAGLLGDRFGRKRLLILGIVIFAVASLVGTVATTPAALIAARALMGLGAAVLVPASMSLIPALFPPAERTRAVSIWTAVFAAGVPLGPVVGGWLLDHYWWGSIFLVNIPMLALALIAAVTLLPESLDPTVPRIDLLGVFLSTIGLSALVYGIIEAPVDGWTDAAVLTALGLGVVVLGLFAWWQSKAATPIMDVDLLRRPSFRWPAFTATLATLVLFGLLFVVPQYLQVLLENDAFGTGIRLMPLLLGLVAGGVATDRLAHRCGHKPIVVVGLFVLAAGCAVGTATGPSDGYGFTVGWFIPTGIGLGLAIVPSMDLVLKELPDDEAGRGGGLVMTLRQVGAAFGVAVLGSILSSIYRGRVHTDTLPPVMADIARSSVGGAARVAEQFTAAPAKADLLMASASDAYLDGMAVTLAVCAISALVGGLLAWWRLPGRRSPVATSTATEPRGELTASEDTQS
ncbi:MFS transporter [Nocardia sp. NPDC046473]|uniref:MFS transporter n=1 Tax=Nocardia sp. NPDC046473 TaxID=3155733 RepID=UPI0034055ECD